MAAEIPLSRTVFKIQTFLCFAKNLKIQNGRQVLPYEPIFPILCFTFFVKNSKIEYNPIFEEEKIFGKLVTVVCFDILWVENFEEIALSHSV